MEEKKDLNSSLYQSFFKNDDRKEKITIELMDKSLEKKKEYCKQYLSLKDTDLDKLDSNLIDQYTKFLITPSEKLKTSIKLINIIKKFIDQIINIKDFNLLTDKHVILQEKILRDYPILQSVLQYKQGRLEEELVTDEIMELAKLTTIKENKNGRLFFKSESVFLSIEIKKAHNKLKNIDKRLDTEMNQTVVELAAIFEGLCKNLIEYSLIYHKDIYSMSKGKPFDYSLLKTSSSIEEIKLVLLEEASTNATMGSLEDWLIKTIEPVVKKNQQTSFFSEPVLADLRELYYRRNLIAHNNSEINKLYLDKNPSYERNSSISICSDEGYLLQRIDTVLEAGLLMLMKFCEKEKIYSFRSGYKVLEEIGLQLLEEGYYKSSSIVFKKQHEELSRYLGRNTPFCFMAYFNYCLSSLIGEKKLPLNESEKMVGIIERLESENEWFNTDPQMCNVAKTVLLQKRNDELLESLKIYFEYVDTLIKSKGENIDFKINFLSLPLLKLLDNYPEFIDYKYSLKYD